jgi:dihydrofolate reductase
MRKLIAAMNMTLDGICDHTAMIADDEIHQHYNELLSSSDAIIYGRITYQLMESYWPTVVKNPTDDKITNEFAVLIDRIPKIVFSHTLKNVEWKNSKLANRSLEEEVAGLKQQPGRDILVGSPGLIVASMNLDLVDELQISIQPTIAGKGLSLFKTINDRVNLKLIKTKVFNSSGSITLYYELAGK